MRGKGIDFFLVGYFFVLCVLLERKRKNEKREILPFVLNLVSSAPPSNTRDAICMSMTNSEDFDRCVVRQKGVGPTLRLHREWEDKIWTDLEIR